MKPADPFASFQNAPNQMHSEASPTKSPCQIASILSLATLSTRCEKAVLMRIESGQFLCESALGLTAEDARALSSLYRHAAKQGTWIAIADLQKDADWKSNPFSKRFSRFASIPIVNQKNEIVGLLAVHGKEPGDFASQEKKSMKHLASLAEILLKNPSGERLQNLQKKLACSQDAFEKAEAFYHSLVESLPQNFLRKDLQGRFTFVNQNFCQTIGKPMEAILGKTDFDFFPDSLAEKYRQDDRHVIETGKRFETTEEHPKGKVERHYVHVIKTPLYDPKGAIVGIQCIFEDVTEQRKTEQELAFERDLLRSLLDSIPDHVYFKDQSSRFIVCSKELSDHLGLDSPETAVGKTDFDFFSSEHARPAFEDEQRIIATGIPVVSKIEREILKNGRANWVLTSKMPFRSGKGDIIGTFGVSKDVTPLIETRQALERARKKYQDIFEQAVEGIFQTSTEGRYLEANPALARIYGYASAQELLAELTDIGRQLYVDPNRRKVFQKLMEERGEVHEFESEIYRRDGTKIWIAETARAVRDDEGKVKYYEGIVENISERKRAEATLQMARDAAIDSTRLKSIFLANMSHEIRTPMNGIIGMAGLLRRTELSEEQSHFANAIEQSGFALLRLINDILDFSKMESGKMKIEKAQFDPAALLESVVELLVGNAQQKGIEVIVWVDPLVPKSVVGDAIRLRQILNNLVGNAIKFTAKGEVRVSLKFVQRQGKQCELQMEVEDTGIGIASEAQAHIFKPFTQADDSTTRKFGGTGLGLAISKQLIELMGGRLQVKSELGIGSKFWFSLPFEPESNVPSPNAFPRKKFNGARVLIVAENRSVCHHLQQTLTPEGFDCALVHDFGQARKIYKEALKNQKPFGYLIVDPCVSGNRGLRLCSQIGRLSGSENVKKFLLCPVGKKISARRLAECDIHGIIAKPVKRHNLMSNLERARGEKAGVSSAVSGVENSVRKPPSPKALQVLVVEDNPVNQSVALHILKELGYQGIAVDNGLEAIAMLNRTHFPIIFMDCQMPELDGYETTRRIREMESSGSDSSRSRIIAMTANAMEGDRERCLAAGMDDYVSKPIMLPAVEAALLGMKSSPASAPKTPLPAAPRLDPDVLANFKKRNDAFDPLADLAELFEQELDKQTSILQNALDKKDKKVFCRTAHTFKGSANNIGARRLAALCESLEHWEKDLDKSQLEILEIIASIEKEARSVVSELSNIVANRSEDS